MILISLAGPAWAEASPADQAAAHLAQAELFYKRRWYADAAAELRAALALPEGRRFPVYWLAAAAAWELQDLDAALAMARGALQTAENEDQRLQAEALVARYEEGFGFLVVQAPYPGMATRMQLEVEGLVVDPEYKRYVNAAALRWRERTALPARLGLPAGAYRVNGQPVTVEPGGEAVLELPMSAIGAKGLAALQVTRLEVSAGIAGLYGPKLDTVLPAPRLQLALTQPVGPVLLGATLDGELANYLNAQRHVVGGVPTWAAGARIGRELVLGGSLSLRPSLGVRYGTVAGVPLRCEGDVCSTRESDAPPDRFVTGTAWRPGAELTVEHREAGRTTALGTGIKLTIEQAIGRVPEGGGGWTAGERGWSAVGVGMLADLSLAF